MKLLDALFIICCNLYKKNDTGIFKESGLLLLAGIGMLNVILVTFIAADLHIKKITIDRLYNSRYYIVALSLIIFFGLLYIRYFIYTSYEEVSATFKNMTYTKRNTYLILGSIYAVLSLLSTIGYAFYSGGQVNGWW